MILTLEDAYESTQVVPKKTFNEENLRELLRVFNDTYHDNVSMTVTSSYIELSKPNDLYLLINMIDARMTRNRGYKLINEKLILPTS